MLLNVESASKSENDEKQLKNLYAAVLPKLCFFSRIPLPVLESLYKLSKSLGNDIKKDHKKILRLVYYFLQVLIGPGQGGVPHKTEFGIYSINQSIIIYLHVLILKSFNIKNMWW